MSDDGAAAAVEMAWEALNRATFAAEAAAAIVAFIHKQSPANPKLLERLHGLAELGEASAAGDEPAQWWRDLRGALPD